MEGIFSAEGPDQVPHKELQVYQKRHKVLV